jgi:hypothetical protein
MKAWMLFFVLFTNNSYSEVFTPGKKVRCIKPNLEVIEGTLKSITSIGLIIDSGDGYNFSAKKEGCTHYKIKKVKVDYYAIDKLKEESEFLYIYEEGGEKVAITNIPETKKKKALPVKIKKQQKKEEVKVVEVKVKEIKVPKTEDQNLKSKININRILDNFSKTETLLKAEPKKMKPVSVKEPSQPIINVRGPTASKTKGKIKSVKVPVKSPPSSENKSDVSFIKKTINNFLCSKFLKENLVLSVISGDEDNCNN